MAAVSTFPHATTEADVDAHTAVFDEAAALPTP
jgi:hypothetical protein